MIAILKSLVSGAVAFAMVFCMAIALSYIKCLALGISYSFSLSIPVAARGALFIGAAIMILTLMAGDRSTPKAKQ